MRNIPGVLNIHNDIKVGRKDTNDHVRALKATFQVIKENNFTLNKKKCEFNKSSVNVFGFNTFVNRSYPDPEKVTFLKEQRQTKISFRYNKL